MWLERGVRSCLSCTLWSFRQQRFDNLQLFERGWRREETRRVGLGLVGWGGGGWQCEFFVSSRNRNRSQTKRKRSELKCNAVNRSCHPWWSEGGGERAVESGRGSARVCVCVCFCLDLTTFRLAHKRPRRSHTYSNPSTPHPSLLIVLCKCF